MLPIALNSESCAVIYENGIIIDEAFNWETAENFASQGYEVVAVADDTWTIGDRTFGTSKEDIQAMCNNALALYRDCFEAA